MSPVPSVFNPVNKGVKFWKEYYVYGINDTSIALGTGTAFEETVLRLDSDADFEWVKTMYVATSDRLKIRVKDDSVGRYLTKRAVDIKNFAGSNQIPVGLSSSVIPYIWSRPHVLSAASNFTMEVADASGVANSIRLSLHGSKIRAGQSPWDRKFRAAIPFMTSISNGPVTIAANGTGSYTVEVDMDAHFLVQKIMGIRTGNALITIGENARGRDWMNTPIHFDSVCGNSMFPNILPSPRFIPRGSVILINLTDLSGGANVIDVVFEGQKLYE